MLVRRFASTVGLEWARSCGFSCREPGRPTRGATPNQADEFKASPLTATVLIVDDDPDVRRFLVDSLDTLGYRAIEAEDGYAGIVALDRFVPDVMIVDLTSPCRV